MKEEANKLSFFHRILEFFLPPKIRNDQELVRKGSLLILTCFGVILVSFGYSIFYFVLGHWIGSGVCLYGGISAIFLAIYFRKNPNFRFAGNFFAFTSFVVLATSTFFTYGLGTQISAWIIIVPLTSSLLAERKSGIFWTLISLVWVFFLFITNDVNLGVTPLVPESTLSTINYAALSGLILYVGMIVWYYERGKELVQMRLEEANQQIEKRNAVIKTAQIDLEKKNREVMRMNLDLEGEVAKRTTKLAQSNLELDTFLYESSHALRRPLARILGLIQILQTETHPDEVKKFSETMSITAKRMDILLHSLVRVSELNSYELKIDQVEVAELVNTVWESMEELVQKENFILEQDIQTNLNFRGDFSLLILILENLFDNSIKYAKSEHVRGKIVRVKGEKDGEWVILKVWDNGLGIHPVMMPKLFEMFSRGTEKSTGSGLGLYMVRRIVERMEGLVSVKSELGEFTEFTLKFPAISNIEGEGIWRAGTRY